MKRRFLHLLVAVVLVCAANTLIDRMATIRPSAPRPVTDVQLTDK